MQVLLFIIRKTYGYQKKEDYIALSQIVLGTGLSKKTICKVLNKLRDMNLVITQKGDSSINKYMFNKHYDTWKPLPKKVTSPKKVISITNKGDKSSPKKPPTIYNNTKDNITKDILPDPKPKKKGQVNPDIKKFIDYFYDKHLKETGEKYYVKGGRDGESVKRMLGTYSLEKLQRFVDVYFWMEDEWIKEKGYSIGKFESNIEKIIKEYKDVMRLKGESGS